MKSPQKCPTIRCPALTAPPSNTYLLRDFCQQLLLFFISLSINQLTLKSSIQSQSIMSNVFFDITIDGRKFESQSSASCCNFHLLIINQRTPVASPSSSTTTLSQRLPKTSASFAPVRKASDTRVPASTASSHNSCFRVETSQRAMALAESQFTARSSRTRTSSSSTTSRSC
jgi:hypothetical protein